MKHQLGAGTILKPEGSRPRRGYRRQSHRGGPTGVVAFGKGRRPLPAFGKGRRPLRTGGWELGRTGTLTSRFSRSGLPQVSTEDKTRGKKAPGAGHVVSLRREDLERRRQRSSILTQGHSLYLQTCSHRCCYRHVVLSNI